MCFAPQRRALFRHRNVQKWSEPPVFSTFWLGNVLRATTACTLRHLNFQKWSGAGVFCTFWLRNVLRATTACNFSSLIWPAGSAPAALASLLFDPPEPQIIGKTQCFATFLFSRICIFFLLTLSLLWSSLFYRNLSLLSASALLCFSSVHIVGSLTSKLPSIIYIYIERERVRQLGLWHSQLNGTIKIDPNHQPVYVYNSCVFICSVSFAVKKRTNCLPMVSAESRKTCELETIFF